MKEILLLLPASEIFHGDIAGLLWSCDQPLEESKEIEQDKHSSPELRPHAGSGSWGDTEVG